MLTVKPFSGISNLRPFDSCFASCFASSFDSCFDSCFASCFSVCYVSYMLALFNFYGFALALRYFIPFDSCKGY